MRWLLLLGIIALATVARAEEEVGQDQEGDLLESDEDSRIDVARMLSDLFDFNDEDDAEHEEVGIDREARAKGEESAVEQRAAAIEPEDQARYNKFMDTFFRMLNADARATIDPLDVPLVTKPARKGAARKGNNKKGKKGEEKKGERKNTKTNKNKGGNKKKGDNKETKNKNRKKGRHPKNSGPKTPSASLSGIASLTRIGDVTVANRKDGKELRIEFKTGPVILKVNRSFGKGRDAVVRSATAESPELTGKMHLSVAANGKDKITRFNIVRPSIVTTSGTLNKDGARSDKNNFMEKSIARITPMAAKKLKLAARDVLQETAGTKLMQIRT